MTFGGWLLRQYEREDWIGQLARHARADDGFRAALAPLDIHERVASSLGGDAEMLHALQMALDEWYGGSYPLHLDRAGRKAAEREQERRAIIEAERLEAEAKRRARNAAARARRARGLVDVQPSARTVRA